MTTVDDAHEAYWGDDRSTRLIAQAQEFAATCAAQARWAVSLGEHRYAAWCQERAARAAETARMMRDLSTA